MKYTKTIKKITNKDETQLINYFKTTRLSAYSAVGKITLEIEKHNSTAKITNIKFKPFYLDKKSCPQDLVEKEVPELKEFVEKDIIERYKSREEVIIGEVKEDETIKLTDLVSMMKHQVLLLSDFHELFIRNVIQENV